MNQNVEELVAKQSQEIADLKKQLASLEELSTAEINGNKRIIRKDDYYVELEYRNNKLDSLYTKSNKTQKCTSINGEPSLVYYSTVTGYIVEKRWYLDGNLYREDGLPTIERYRERKLYTRCYASDLPNYARSKELPNYFEYYPDGRIHIESYGYNFNKGTYIRQIDYQEYPVYHKSYEHFNISEVTNLPITICYNHFGTVIKVTYSIKNTEDLPTLREWDYSGKSLIEEKWEILKEHLTTLHRELDKGPALIKYHNGEQYSKMYYVNGEFISCVCTDDKQE